MISPDLMLLNLRIFEYRFCRGVLRLGGGGLLMLLLLLDRELLLPLDFRIIVLVLVSFLHC